MMGTLIALLLLGAVAAAVYARFARGRAPHRDSVDAFAAARAVTNRWSQDPSSTPQPLRDYLGAQRKQRGEDTSDE